MIEKLLEKPESDNSRLPASPVATGFLKCQTGKGDLFGSSLKAPSSTKPATSALALIRWSP